MISNKPLDLLAQAHHIESDYIDIWGQRHTIGDDTKRALLIAMGVPADNDDAIDAGLGHVRKRSVERFAPSVLVIPEGTPIIAPLAIDADRSGWLVWTFTTESGATVEGEAVLADLEITGTVWRKTQRALHLPLQTSPGYHRLTLVLAEKDMAEIDIIVTPNRAYWPDCFERESGLAGLTVPLYGLRSCRNAGIGDFGDLADVAKAIAPKGADFIGINPVHALFPTQPGRISPYAPSSRLFLNGLHIALDRTPEFETSEKAKLLMEGDAGRALQTGLRANKLVGYTAVATFKREVLEALFEGFMCLPPSSPRRSAFEAFRTTAGDPLERHARFEAMAEDPSISDAGRTDWREWPSRYRRPDLPDVQAFAAERADRVTFYAYLQWLAAEQLDGAQRSAISAGMALGLYLDLAVGVAPDGAEAWAHQDALVAGVRLGAPPDDFNPQGQNWGLLPFSPTTLQAEQYRPFIDLLRHNMRSAGALRIDHVLGLARSFWWPEGSSSPGAYIRYPLQDLLGIVALESLRNRCLVIGEDLGTVPDTLRKTLDSHGLLGCRVIYFERDKDGGCRPPAAYSRASIASIGTHDLPTLKGFWDGRDIAWRERLGLYVDDEKMRADRDGRNDVKVKLLERLKAEGLLPPGIDPEAPPTTLTEPLVLAFHRFLGLTPALLKAVQFEDIVGAEEQANLPGTIDEHPNWRRKIGIKVEDMSLDDRLSHLIEAVAKPSSPLPYIGAKTKIDPSINTTKCPSRS